MIATIDHLNLETLAALLNDGPVTMLNLMRCASVAPARHPSRAAFIAMLTSPDYARANIERENGCAAHTILAIRETYNKLTNAPAKE